MEYQVPQFIEVEDKVVGPLTLKQFIYIAGAAGLCVVFFFYTPTIVALILSGLVAAFAGALAFYKVNGKSFVEIVEAGFSYYTGAKLFRWMREDKPADTRNTAPAQAETAIKNAPRLTRGKLSELAWSLDIGDQHSSGASRES